MGKCCGKNVFNIEWLTDDHFKLRLQKGFSDTAKFKLCCKTFSVSNAGISNVISYNNGKIQKIKVVDWASYSTIAFKNPNKVSKPNKDADLLLRKFMQKLDGHWKSYYHSFASDLVLM